MSAALIVQLVIALLPLIEKALAWLSQRMQDGSSLRPGEQRRLGIVLHHVGRLRQRLELLEAHGEAIGVQAQEGDIGDADA